MNARVAELLKQGQSIWQDDISRHQIASGGLADLVQNVGVRGVTSNPTIFEKAISTSSDYDAQIAELAAQNLTDAEIFEELEVTDIRDACDIFRSVYDESDGADGFVSIEVTPDLARNPSGTEEAVRRLWRKVDRPNLMVKIPGTIEGAEAIHQMMSEGVNINITLLFSIEAYERVANAYISAISQRYSDGFSIHNVASVASFFVSRVDVLVDKELDKKIAQTSDKNEKQKLESLKGKAAVANAKLAYVKFQELFSIPQWQAVQDAGARRQRPLWASTSTKNPAYSDVLYVDTLIGPDTVNTLPNKTMEAFIDHGVIARSVDTGIDEARQVIADLEAAGISMKAVTDELENEGISKFEESIAQLYAAIEGKRASLAGVGD